MGSLLVVALLQIMALCIPMPAFGNDAFRWVHSLGFALLAGSFV